MQSEATIDFSYAKNALFVRQTFARFLGLPLTQEFTWNDLHAHACDPANTRWPKCLLVRGLTSMSVNLPEEARMFRSVIKELGRIRPDVEIQIVLHE